MVGLATVVLLIVEQSPTAEPEATEADDEGGVGQNGEDARRGEEGRVGTAQTR